MGDEVMTNGDWFGHSKFVRADIAAAREADLRAEVERLTAANREAAMKSLADLGQAQEALDRAIAAEAEAARLRGLLDTARQEGVSLGLAMASARLSASEVTEEDLNRLGDWAKEWIGLSQAEAEAILALAPIPPHVAAARVLLDDLRLALASDRPPEGSASGLRWIKAHDAAESAPTSMSRPTPIQMIRAALESIAKEGE